MSDKAHLNYPSTEEEFLQYLKYLSTLGPVQKPGINFKELDNERVRQSYHMWTFIRYFAAWTNENGWMQLDLEKLAEAIKGYTHRFWHVHRKQTIPPYKSSSTKVEGFNSMNHMEVNSIEVDGKRLGKIE